MMMHQDYFSLRRKVIEYNEQLNPNFLSICQPLFQHLNIKRFGYFKYMLDADQRCIGCFGIATDLFSFPDLLSIGDTGETWTNALRAIPLEDKGYFLWPTNSNCVHLKILKEKSNLTKGLGIYQRKKEYLEGFCFSTFETESLPQIFSEKALAPFNEFIKYFMVYSSNFYSLYRFTTHDTN